MISGLSHPRLTLNVGLRFDSMSNSYGKGQVFANPETPFSDVSNLPVLRERQGTGNVFDFNNFSPRLGATYSITNDGKTVARASYGRYYAPVGLENLRRFGPDMPLATIDRLSYSIPWDQVDTNHNGMIDPDEVTNMARLLHDLSPYAESTRTVDQSWEATVAQGTKNQFMDQWTVNFEREIFHDLFVFRDVHPQTDRQHPGECPDQSLDRTTIAV